MTKTSKLAEFGLNLEKNNTDLKIDLAYEVQSEEHLVGSAQGRIVSGYSTPRGIEETNDELSYFQDAEPLKPDHQDLLAEVRSLLPDDPHVPPANHSGKWTCVNAVTVDPKTGLIGIRFGLMLVIGGQEVPGTRRWHRCALDPDDGYTVNAVVSNINDDITRRPTLGAAAVSEDRLLLLERAVSTVHDPALLSGYRAAKAAKVAKGILPGARVLA